MTPPTSERLWCPPKPGTAEHNSYITASKVPAILGYYQYRNIHDIYAGLLHPTDAPAPDDDELARRFRWGHAAESAMLDFWQAEKISCEGHLHRQPAYRNTVVGRHFPHLVTPDGTFVPTSKGTTGRGRTLTSTDPRDIDVIECKTGSAYGTFIPATDGPDILAADAIQLTTQMSVIGSNTGWLVRLEPNDDYPQISLVMRDPKVWALIATTCTHLWKLVQTRREPDDVRDELQELMLTANYEFDDIYHPGED